MKTPLTDTSKKQYVFRELILGTLIYSVVLGFFDDYTDLLDTRSYSTTFLAAAVLQILTYLTIALKGRVVHMIKSSEIKRKTPITVLGVWLIMFLSKFVFLAVIDVIFGDAIDISGFVGLVVIIVVMMMARKLIDNIYQRLGQE